MYKLTDKKQKIKAFRLFRSDVYFIQNDGENLSKLSFNQRYLQTELISIPKQGNYHRVYFLQESIIFVDSSNKGWLLDKSGKMNELSFQYYFYDESLKKGVTSEVFSYNPYSVKQEVFDLEQNKVLWNRENSFIRMPLSDMFFETPTKGDLIFLDKDTGTPLWHFPLTTLNDLYPEIEAEWEITHFIQVVDDILWVCVSAKQDKWLRSKGGALLGLEASTGHIKHFLYHTHPQTEKALAHLPEYRATGYDANKNILLGISLYHYWEVDLSAAVPQIKMWNLEEEAKKYKAWFAEITLGAISPTHIFALSSQSSIEIEAQVSALNRETLQIDWHYVFAQPKGGILHPTKAELTETHLFVLDSQGTLHIFEKE